MERQNRRELLEVIQQQKEQLLRFIIPSILRDST
jgi:hypothetical protein